jgi:hypothetical protein
MGKKSGELARPDHKMRPPSGSPAQVKSRFPRFLDIDNRVLVDKNIKRRHHPMPTKDGFNPDHPLPLFLSADEPEQQGIGKAWDRAVISSRVLKASILVATATAIGIAILSVGNPVTLFADVTASLVDTSALQPGTDQSTPTIQSTADAQALAPIAKDAPTRDEIAAASEPAGQSQTENENSEPSSEALYRQFQAWAAEEGTQAQVKPVQPVQDAPAQVVENAPAPVRPMQKRRRARSGQNARAEIRHVQRPQAKVQREQNARVQVRPVQDARAQDQSVQNAQVPSFLQIFDPFRASPPQRGP